MLRASSRVVQEHYYFKNLQVKFVGEEAEDGGGPRRELWRLLALSIKSTYFEGIEDNLIIRHDTLAVQVNTVIVHKCP